MHDHIARNYERKRAKGLFDRALALKGLVYCADAAAKDYKRVFNHWFAPAIRRECAEMLFQSIECEWACCNSWL